VRNFLLEKQTPRDIATAVQKHSVAKYEQVSIFDEESITSALPESIVRDILSLRHKDELSIIPIFRHIPNRSIVLYIFQSMTPHFFESGHYLVRLGELPKYIFFIISGAAKVLRLTAERRAELMLDNLHGPFSASRKGLQRGMSGRGMDLNPKRNMRCKLNKRKSTLLTNPLRQEGDYVEVDELVKGDFTGHQAVLRGERQAVSVRASTVCSTYTLSFKEIVRLSAESEALQYHLVHAFSMVIHKKSATSGKARARNMRHRFLINLRQRYRKMKKMKEKLISKPSMSQGGIFRNISGDAANHSIFHLGRARVGGASPEANHRLPRFLQKSVSRKSPRMSSTVLPFTSEDGVEKLSESVDELPAVKLFRSRVDSISPDREVRSDQKVPGNARWKKSNSVVPAKMMSFSIVGSNVDDYGETKEEDERDDKDTTKTDTGITDPTFLVATAPRTVGRIKKDSKWNIVRDSIREANFGSPAHRKWMALVEDARKKEAEKQRGSLVGRIVPFLPFRGSMSKKGSKNRSKLFGLLRSLSVKKIKISVIDKDELFLYDSDEEKEEKEIPNQKDDVKRELARFESRISVRMPFSQKSLACNSLRVQKPRARSRSNPETFLYSDVSSRWNRSSAGLVSGSGTLTRVISDSSLNISEWKRGKRLAAAL